jgi:hypothetical protein
MLYWTHGLFVIVKQVDLLVDLAQVEPFLIDVHHIAHRREGKLAGRCWVNEGAAKLESGCYVRRREAGLYGILGQS